MCFSPYLGTGCGGGGGVSPGIQPACAVFHPEQLKNRSFRNLFFFDIVTTQYGHPRYVKHVLGHICVFFTLFGYWVRGGGGGQAGLVQNLLVQFFSLYSSKIKVFKTFFF